MNLIGLAAARLSRQDMLQGLTVLLAAMCVVLALRWPAGAAIVNDSWFVLAPVRCVLLAFGGLAWGTALGCRQRRSEMGESYVPLPWSPPFGEAAWHREVAATLVAMLSLAVVTAPFDVLAHAATYPGVSVGWSLAAATLSATGFFGLGLVLGRGARIAHLVALLPLLVPAVLAGAVWLDLALGIRLANPWFAALRPAPWYAGLMALATVAAVITAVRRPEETK
ncbi:MAG TPA: hypothetical protein VF164_06720 [Trueperaceae bacterium]